MDDNDSLAGFQNPAATVSPGVGIGQLAEELKSAEVVTDSHVPSMEAPKPDTEAKYGPYGSIVRTGPTPAELQAAAEKSEREHIITRLTRLNHKPNFPTISFNPNVDSLHTLRRLNRLATHAGRLKMSVSFMKRSTIFLCRLIEGICARFPMVKKYGLNLEGFSEHLMLSINSFDSVLEDCYDYYSDVIVEASPLLIYIGSIGSQMLVYSATKTIMAKAQDAAASRRAKEQKARDDEIAELMRQRNRSSTSMSGPTDDVSESELDNVSVGFKSVTSTEAPPSPSRTVRFQEPEREPERSREPEPTPPTKKAADIPQTDGSGRVVINLE